MTRLIKGRYRDADKCYSWAQAADEHEPIRNLFPIHSDRFIRLNAKLRLSDKAWRQLCAMNDFDRGKVAEELLQIVASPTDPLHSDASRRNALQRLQRVRYPFKSYHYAITYAVAPDGRVLVRRFWFDKDLVGVKPHPSMERNLLYVVNRTGDARFSENFRQLGTTSRQVTDRLNEAWGDPKPTGRVDTHYAAVNGMLNDLTKASWLMGVHLDTAYPDGGFDQYSLFHNPTDSAWEDLLECAYDKRAPSKKSSSNAHHLAAVLREAQQRRHQTHWVAHSQGAIIFTQAVKLAALGGRLDCHRVSLHGMGSNLVDTELACQQVGIPVDRVRNNPFDPVPNVAGCNALTTSGLFRSLYFLPSVKRGDALASPHTLPYLGLETYIDQLRFTGHHWQARQACRYLPRN
jgi:hypothetical protein